MKKTLFLLCLGMFVISSAFSQMSFKRNTTQKPSFDLTEKSALVLNNNYSDSKVFISNEENEMSKSRRRSSRRRGGSSEGGGVIINVGLGYGLGLGSQNVTNFTDKTYSMIDTSTATPLLPSTFTNTEDQINVSLGKGLCINGSLGYMINGNLGFEVGMSYLIGAKITATKTSTNTTYITDLSVSKDEDTYTYQAKMFRLNPTVIIASGMEGINPYAKFGMTLGFGSFTAEQSKNNTTTMKRTSLGKADTVITSNTSAKNELSGGMAIGFNATLGCAFTVSENISIFAEINMVNMSYSPDKNELTEYTVNGVNQLPNMTVSQKQINYYETLVTSNATIYPTTEPSQALKQSLNFGSIGLNIGMKINF